MTGLLLILTEGPGERLAAAVEVAAAAAALGRPVAVLLRASAVTALGDARVAKALDLLFELGVDIGLCQTALADTGLTAAALPPGVEVHGLVGFLAGREAWQLLLA